MPGGILLPAGLIDVIIWPMITRKAATASTR